MSQKFVGQDLTLAWNTFESEKETIMILMGSEKKERLRRHRLARYNKRCRYSEKPDPCYKTGTLR
jgi:hypothetical protein